MWSFAKKKSLTLPFECKKLILLNALFQGGRLFVGAICVLYFLSFNLNPEDYAWIKTTQAVMFICLDIPLGYLLNKLGEFKSLLVSLIFGILGVLGYLILTNFFGFLLSEVFLALSLSTWPVALSAYSMRVLDNYKTEGLTEKFFHIGDAVSNLFTLICGSIGGLLYVYDKHFPYGCFLAFYLIAVLSLIFFFEDFGNIKSERKNGYNGFFSNIKEIVPLLPLASVIFIAQFLMQPLFHYWQPLFREVFGAESKTMSIVFISYSLSMSTISWRYSHIAHFSMLRTNLFALSSAIIGSVFYCLVSRLNIFGMSLLCFALSFGLFNLVQISFGVLIQKKLKQENRMILTKYISFYSRIGMILSLMVLHLLFLYGWTTLKVYQLYGLLALCIFSFSSIGVIWNKKLKKKYIS